MNTKEAILELRKSEKKKFNQSLDIVINLQKIDPRKESINTLIFIPNPSKKRICAFLSKKSSLVDTVVKEEFDSFKDNKSIKHLANKYDAFISSAPLMASVATKFGRFLGPLGKMPSPQGGLVVQETEENIKSAIDKMSKSAKLRVKEKSIKLSIGKEDMSDEKLIENIDSVIESISKILPNNKDNIKNISIKWTMSSPVKIDK